MIARLGRVSLALLMLSGCVGTEGLELASGAETYGADNRREVWNPDNSAESVALSRSAVALIPWASLKKVSAGMRRIDAPSLGKRYKLCAGERFQSQPSASRCSGVLVGPDLVVTAGHCFQDVATCDDEQVASGRCFPDGRDCDAYAVVFGFDQASAEDNGRMIPEADIYHCAGAVAKATSPYVRDFAVLRLDRPVPGSTSGDDSMDPVLGRDPIPLERDRAAIVAGTGGFAMIGSPVGVPLKIEEGFGLHEALPDVSYFVTMADAYDGHSGAMVVREGRLAGIHVGSGSDFVIRAPTGCYQSRRCTEISWATGCPGSSELYASVFAEHVPLLPTEVATDAPLDP